VGKKPFTMLLDSGADHSVVHPKVVQPHEWLGRCTSVKGVGGIAQQAPLAKVYLYVSQTVKAVHAP
jgi:hypothetical protein